FGGSIRNNSVTGDAGFDAAAGVPLEATERNLGKGPWNRPCLSQRELTRSEPSRRLRQQNNQLELRLREISRHIRRQVARTRDRLPSQAGLRHAEILKV